jgi:hypothetical protein
LESIIHGLNSLGIIAVDNQLETPSNSCKWPYKKKSDLFLVTVESERVKAQLAMCGSLRKSDTASGHLGIPGVIKILQD